MGGGSSPSPLTRTAEEGRDRTCTRPFMALRVSENDSRLWATASSGGHTSVSAAALSASTATTTSGILFSLRR